MGALGVVSGVAAGGLLVGGHRLCECRGWFGVLVATVGVNVVGGGLVGDQDWFFW